MIKIALQGLIASGKSEVEKLLEKRFLVVDLDKVSNVILKNSKKVFEEFETFDKKKIASIVFYDSKKLLKLEGIIYPKLKQYIIDLFKKHEKTPAVFVSGALLYKEQFEGLFDKTIFVDAPYNLRLERLKQRNGLNEAQAKKRMDCQVDKGKNQADFIIENNSSIEELSKKLDSILLKLNLI